MLQLNAEQVQCLEAIALQRDVRRLTDAMSAAFPDVAGRLGDRYTSLVAHVVQRGAAHGLTHALCVARYLACWFMLGAEFEHKPAFTWALGILSDTGRAQGAKVFQLCRRTREELSRLSAQSVPVPGMLSAAAFDAALAVLDGTLIDSGTLGSLFPGGRIQLGAACDIDALDLRLHDVQWRHHYTVVQGQWRRVPCVPELAQVTLTAGVAPRSAPAAGASAGVSPAVSLPEQLTLLSHPVGGQAVRLRVRTRAASCCDPKVHPLVALNSTDGLTEWRGPLASDVMLSLHSQAPEAPAAGALQPAIAVEGAALRSMLSFASCGLRDAGQSLGDLSTQLAIYPAEQHLLAWRREPSAPLSWPEPATGQAGVPSAHCRVERDGLPLDASRWQAGLEELDRQLAEGLGRLLTAWERESGVGKGRMNVEPALLVGAAGLTWGWAEGPRGVVEPAHLRIEGLFDLVACQLNLRLAGELELGGSLSHLTLQCVGREMLQVAWQRDATRADLLAALMPAQVSFRHLFELQLEPLAHPGLAMLSVAGPSSGALVGSCGLRLRSDGPGLQWFARLAIEPVQVALHLHDPVLGQQQLTRPLLPAMSLLNWSLG